MNLLPGPVAVSPRVQAAFGQAPISHRSRTFHDLYQQTTERLRSLTSARFAQVMIGSGTLANDVVAGQLAVGGGRGLILSNGEFGERLIDHASRFSLTFDVIRFEWGEPFDALRVEQNIDQQLHWLWFVHCETSTGVLNDLGWLSRLCRRRGVRLCVDCVSSIGTVPVNLSDVFVASCSSGKGLRAYPGLALVVGNYQPVPTQRLPRYLDLGSCASCDGVPFTHSSNLVSALRTALDELTPAQRFAETRKVSRWLRSRLHELGYDIVAADEDAAPAVLTIALPPSVSSHEVGSKLARADYLTNFASNYLLQRNWIQVCLMADHSSAELELFLEHLRRTCRIDRARAWMAATLE